MPTYEYACAACGHEWEQTQRITEPAIEVCPVCDKSTAHRLISAGTNFILKGGGWYSDLYASPKPSTEAAEKKSDKKSEKSDANGATSPATPGGESTAKPAAAATPSATPSTSSGTSAGHSSGTSSAPSSPDGQAH